MWIRKYLLVPIRLVIHPYLSNAMLNCQYEVAQYLNSTSETILFIDYG